MEEPMLIAYYDNHLRTWYGSKIERIIGMKPKFYFGGWSICLIKVKEERHINTITSRKPHDL